MTSSNMERIIDGLGLIRLFFLIPRTLLLSFVCISCSISAIGAIGVLYFKIPTHSRVMAGKKGRGSEIS